MHVSITKSCVRRQKLSFQACQVTTLENIPGKSGYQFQAWGGASNGARSIVFFNHGSNVFFFDMYLKSKLSKKSGKELEKDEIDAYCAIAEDFIAMTEKKIADLLKDNHLIEVTCDD
ncbi:type II toxin-antitoxin system RelE/ParE family toxin [Salmonella enterica]